MTAPKKRCFVVMGFGEKVDFATGRKLNLDASYHNLIKPAVEDAGLECVRADELIHSGNINVPMYEQILKADLVIADLSTSNVTAFYELGVRHALRPYTTIIIAEDKFTVPFDIAHVHIRTYKHLGDDIGVSEVKRFRAALKKTIVEILEREPPQEDSPVYTFLDKLRPPVLSGVTFGAREAASADDEGKAAMNRKIREQVDEAKEKGDFLTAKKLLYQIRDMTKGKGAWADAYIITELVEVIAKSKHPTPQRALEEARDLLLTLNPSTSNVTGVKEMWGGVHQFLWEETHERAHLEEAVRSFESAFYLRKDYRFGNNLAYLLNVRAANAESRAESVADFIEALRVRREVLAICEEKLADDSLSEDERYVVFAVMAEAHLGMGDEANAERRFQETAPVASEPAIKETAERMNKLRSMLADSPLKYVIAA